MHLPHHLIRGLFHFKRQEREEDEVRDGEVEEEHVDWGGPATHFAAEGTKRQDVGWDPHQKGDDVDSEQEFTAQHGDQGRTLSDTENKAEKPRNSKSLNSTNTELRVKEVTTKSWKNKQRHRKESHDRK